MTPDSSAPDIDPLAPRRDDPRFFRRRLRLTDSPRAGGSPLRTIAITALVVATAVLFVWAASP
jgi:hypothetical protein